MQFSVTDGLKRAARRFGDSSAMSVAVVDRLEKNSAQRCRVRSYFFFDEDFLRGTLAPAFRAWDNPIAIACFLLVTFLPERPLLRVLLPFLHRLFDFLRCLLAVLGHGFFSFEFLASPSAPRIRQPSAVASHISHVILPWPLRVACAEIPKAAFPRD